MGTIGRRRRLTLTALAAAAAAPLSPGAGVSAEGLTTVFSCGSRWTTARSCSDLCPSGDDSSCPPGQHCHGGIRCEGGEGATTDEALERQRRLEERELRRIALRRAEEYVERFVCGRSFEEAAERCTSAGSDSDSYRRGTAAHAAVSYCPSGSSDECPAHTRCFAAVPCPREREEVPSSGRTPLDRPPSVVAEPSVPLDASATDRNDTAGRRLARDEERGSSPAAVSSWGETWSGYARGAFASLDSLRYYGSH